MPKINKPIAKKTLFPVIVDGFLNSVSLRYPAQACVLFPGEKQKGEHQNEKAYFFIAAGLRAGPNPHARRFCGGIRPYRRIPRGRSLCHDPSLCGQDAGLPV